MGKRGGDRMDHQQSLVADQALVIWVLTVVAGSFIGAALSGWTGLAVGWVMGVAAACSLCATLSQEEASPTPA